MIDRAYSELGYIISNVCLFVLDPFSSDVVIYMKLLINKITEIDQFIFIHTSQYIHISKSTIVKHIYHTFTCESIVDYVIFGKKT